MAVTAAVLPSLLRKAEARIVNVCSQAGKLRILRSDALRKRFEEVSAEDQARALLEGMRA
jgi:hypothetical protein